MDRDNKKFVLVVIEILKKKYKNPKCALNFSKPFDFLVAVILSAQCTDKRVNEITEKLFKKYKSTKSYAQAKLLELQKDIKSAGFFRNKAKNIIKSAKLSVEKFDGKIPQTMEELLTFPGAARKTANVVLGTVFNKAQGIAVDTHVIRLSNLLKLTESVIPVKIEKDLIEIVPKKYWIKFSHWMQILGREVCKARNPNCLQCCLNKICPSSKCFRG
ncbi:MAG: endonuclease III [Elusimicrobiota bacterium]|jgi:endonuclease-3|nr:endonuclease III [Elusimicrobiota bacterium]